MIIYYVIGFIEKNKKKSNFFKDNCTIISTLYQWSIDGPLIVDWWSIDGPLISVNH